MKFYVYEWYIVETEEIFYVGKGCKKRCSSVSKRNQIFKNYLNSYNCSYRKIKFFDSENEALKYENQRILELKNQGYCKANLDNGGNGGNHFTWTQEMREYKSIYNPMKSKDQRKRMIENNPMNKKEIVEKVIKSKSKPIIYNNKEYLNAKTLAKECGLKSENSIYYWLKRGYGKNLMPCYYKGETPKDFKIKNHETSNKPVIIDGVLYRNIKIAAKNIGVWSESIIKAIKNNRKCKGHICKYANQQPSHEKSKNKSIVEGSTTNE